MNAITTILSRALKGRPDRRRDRHAFRPTLSGLEARISLSGTVTTINPPPAPILTSPAPTP